MEQMDQLEIGARSKTQASRCSIVNPQRVILHISS